MAQIHQIAEGISRISSFSPTVGINSNQFLLDNEHPTPLHTEDTPRYEGVRQTVSDIFEFKL